MSEIFEDEVAQANGASIWPSLVHPVLAEVQAIKVWKGAKMGKGDIGHVSGTTRVALVETDVSVPITLMWSSSTSSPFTSGATTHDV